MSVMQRWQSPDDQQKFCIEIRDINVGEMTSYEDWFDRAKELSVQNPGKKVVCHSISRVRRVYLNGHIYRDFPTYPYLGEQTFQW